MLTQAQVQRYSTERGILDRMAFKGGTCLRKMFLGNQGRFSTDLDFTGIEEHDHEDVILAMMEAFEQPFHGIQFAIPDEGYYETQDGLSWGVNPTYVHDWNQAGSESKLQISRRETPTLPTERQAQNRAELFQIPAICAGRTRMPSASRNPRRENTCVLSAE